MDYSASGVDVCRAERLVQWLKGNQNIHHQDRILSDMGGFASLFQIQFPEMKEPCLASSTDGVGTKLKLAVQFSSLESLGQDLVAMCVNDLLCVGAKPLFFLDYYACGELKEDLAKALLRGIQQACETSGCSLIGGETAEMPGLYKGLDFDCAGFAVGVVDRPCIIGKQKVKKGNQLLALPSNGFHSNGYSLLRKVFESDVAQWKEELLKPTTLYAEVFEKVLKGKVHALAHITGGGINNILRVVPLGATVKLQSWKIPKPFLEVQKRAKLSTHQLLTTFNCGVGLVAFVDSSVAPSLLEDLKNFGMDGFLIGEVSDVLENQPTRWITDWTQWK